MGIYRRRDSVYWWLALEGTPVRASTKVPVDGGSPAQNRELKRQAQALYAARMAREAVRAFATSPRRTTVPKPLQRSPKGWCYLYVVQSDTLVKIGRAVDVNDRMRELQTGNGRVLQLLAAVPAHAIIEDAVHAHFNYLREQGEWFRVDPDLAAFIEALQQGMNPIALLW